VKATQGELSGNWRLEGTEKVERGQQNERRENAEENLE